jgi:hypothetical protein
MLQNKKGGKKVKKFICVECQKFNELGVYYPKGQYQFRMCWYCHTTGKLRFDCRSEEE